MYPNRSKESEKRLGSLFFKKYNRSYCGSVPTIKYPGRYLKFNYPYNTSSNFYNIIKLGKNGEARNAMPQARTAPRAGPQARTREGRHGTRARPPRRPSLELIVILELELAA